MLKHFNKNRRNNRNISIFTSISYHSVFSRPPSLFFQHNQQYDTLLPILPCTHKLKAGIAYCEKSCALSLGRSPSVGGGVRKLGLGVAGTIVCYRSRYRSSWYLWCCLNKAFDSFRSEMMSWKIFEIFERQKLI